MFGRYSLTDIYGITPGPLPAPAVGQTASASSPTTAHGAALSETHTFTPHMINDFRMGFNRLSTARLTQVTDRIIEQYGFKGIPFFSDVGGLPAINVTGYQGIGEGGTLPNLKLSQVTQIQPTASRSSTAAIRSKPAPTSASSSAMRSRPAERAAAYTFSGAFTQNPQKPRRAPATDWPTCCSASRPTHPSPHPPSATCGSATTDSTSRTTGR